MNNFKNTAFASKTIPAMASTRMNRPVAIPATTNRVSTEATNGGSLADDAKKLKERLKEVEAKLHVPKAMAGSLQDQGATPLALFDHIDQTDGLEVPAMSDGLMPAFEQIVRTWRRLARLSAGVSAISTKVQTGRPTGR